MKLFQLRVARWPVLKGLAVCASLMLALPAIAGYPEGQHAYSKGDYSAAYAEWSPLAGAGHVESMVALGDLYLDGKGVGQSWDLAIRWWTKAAEHGHLGSQLQIGKLYKDGDPYGRKDLVEAKKWFKLAAKQDSVEGIAALGRIEYESRDYATALPHLQLACRRRNAGACRDWWLMLRNGNGVLPDKVEATRKYSRALALYLLTAFPESAECPLCTVKAYALYHFTNDGPDDAPAVEAANHLVMTPDEIQKGKALLLALKAKPVEMWEILQAVE